MTDRQDGATGRGGFDQTIGFIKAEGDRLLHEDGSARLDK
jgi:hypothetical protein